MSDTQTAPAPVEATETDNGSKEPFDADRAMEKIRKANSEAENLRRRVKELEPLAKRAQDLEEQQKTAEQKLAEQNRTLEERTQTAELEATRLRVALRHGLTEGQAKRLVGTTEEELDSDAKAYVEELTGGEQTAQPVATTPRPRETLKPGATSNTPIGDDDTLMRSVKQKLGIT